MRRRWIPRPSNARLLIAMLALGLLLPPPFFLWVAGQLRGLDSAGDAEASLQRTSLTDVAPRQPVLARIANDEPAARLTRLGVAPLPAVDASPPTAEERSLLGATERELIQSLEQSSPDGVPALVLPDLNRPVRDPYIRPPSRVNHRRSG